MKQLALIGILALLSLQVSAGREKTLHHDERKTPKMVFHPKTPAANVQGEALARIYLKENWKKFRLQTDAANLEFYRVKHSLLGAHYYYRQMLHGIVVENADVVVSIAKDGKIYQVFNNSYPMTSPVARPEGILLNEDDALDVSWQHLKVHGDLLLVPEAQKVWLLENGGFTLIYRAMVSTNAPMGSWSVAVNARNGRVISAHDIRINHRRSVAPDYRDYDGPLTDRVMETALARKKAAELKAKAGLAVNRKRAEGSGRVFDPDPRTTLNDASLEDTNPPEDFEDAYFIRPLAGITEEDGVFKLLGDWVEIRTLSSRDTGPNTPVTTTTDGFWDFRRGEQGFNDAMTYYHIDQNQKYIQDLGFYNDPNTGVNTGIQHRAIPVDTDAYNGGDNSFFDGASNVMGFGHGCVDDNEDADVILHEYGHALQHDIDERWSLTFSPQDSGAMGEGFGDYWGSSYSLKTENGLVFEPAWIYTWDGHNFSCADGQFPWNGRNMDVMGAEYTPGVNYGWHENWGDFISDELWGTPLFQGMFTLFKRGIPISESDRLVLQSHYGLVPNVSMDMPTLAEATVNTARMLHPDGPHAQVFHEAFARHNILDHISEYVYYATHVPPSGDSGTWTNEIQLTNPNDAATDVTVTLYESDATGIGLSSYGVAGTETLNIKAYETITYTPGGANQRWVRFDSNLPIAGTNFFRRNLGEEQGSEEAGIPLFSETEVSRDIVIPHIPANRDKFWSGMVLVNPGVEQVALSIELIGANGNNLNDLLSETAPTTLEPLQKWVTFLAPGPGGAEGLFDDSASNEKVSYVKVTAGGEVGGFQLFGYQQTIEGGEVATSGIMAVPDQNRTHWPIRVSLTDSEWAGFTLLNPSDESITLNVRALDVSGATLDETTVTMRPRQKLLGLNEANRFQFPSNGANLINLPNGSDVQTVLITMDENMRTFGVNQPLRVFELGGDLGSTELDGGAVMGLANKMVFTKPSGKLEIFKAVMDGDVVVTTRTADGADPQTYTMTARQTLQLTLTGDIESIEVSGDYVSAVLINRDADNRALTILNGKPMEFTTHGE